MQKKTLQVDQLFDYKKQYDETKKTISKMGTVSYHGTSS